MAYKVSGLEDPNEDRDRLDELSNFSGNAGKILAVNGTEDATEWIDDPDSTVGLINGIVKADGAGTISAAVAGTDYSTPSSTDTFTNKTFDANGTGNSISNIDVADLANGTDGELITWGADAAPTTVSAGTSGQVLTSNGAGAAPTFQAAAAGGSTPQQIISSIFETSTRFSTSTSGGSGSNSFSSSGSVSSTGATQASYQRVQLRIDGSKIDMTENFTFTFNSNINGGAGEQYHGYIGFGTTTPSSDGSDLTGLVTDQCGVKFSNEDGSTDVASATNSGGTSETSTVLSSIDPSVGGSVYSAVNDGSSIKYYVDNTLKATHTTNLPDNNSVNCAFNQIIDNDNTTSTISFSCYYFSLSIDAT